MKMMFKLIAALSMLASVASASALEIQPYTAAALSAAQQAGKPVALHFHADWCPTCRAQEKSFQSLKADKELDLTLLIVDYDKERELKKQLQVRAQSTVIVYKGSKETARSGGETDAAKLKAVLKSAL
jgi:thioredoxin 1